MSKRKDTIDLILDQVGSGTRDEAILALQVCKGNVTDAICRLLNLQKEEPKPKTEWEERREIVAAYELEMHRATSHIKPTIQPDGTIIRTLPTPAAAPKST